MRKEFRLELADRLKALPVREAAPFAELVRGAKAAEAGRVVPCWGSLIDEFDRRFDGDEDRVVVWEEVLGLGDSRALIAILLVSRSRPAFLKRVLERAEKLPSLVQRALVSLPEAAPHIAGVLPRLHPAAAQLWEAGPEALEREREVVESMVGALRAQRGVMPAKPGGRDPGRPG